MTLEFNVRKEARMDTYTEDADALLTQVRRRLGEDAAKKLGAQPVVWGRELSREDDLTPRSVVRFLVYCRPCSKRWEIPLGLWCNRDVLDDILTDSMKRIAAECEHVKAALGI